MTSATEAGRRRPGRGRARRRLTYQRPKAVRVADEVRHYLISRHESILVVSFVPAAGQLNGPVRRDETEAVPAPTPRGPHAVALEDQVFHSCMGQLVAHRVRPGQLRLLLHRRLQSWHPPASCSMCVARRCAASACFEPGTVPNAQRRAGDRVQNLNWRLRPAMTTCRHADVRPVLSGREGSAPLERWSFIIMRNIVIVGCRTFNEIAVGAPGSPVGFFRSVCASWSALA